MTTHRPRPAKNRKDIGKVVFPIEKLMAARAASSSCVHIEADLESDSGLTKPAENQSGPTSRGLVSTE